MPHDKIVLPAYLNTEQAAEYLSRSTQYMEIARHKGTGPRYYQTCPRGAVRYKILDLDEWMDVQQRHHTAENGRNK